MTPDQVLARTTEWLGPQVETERDYGLLTADVPRGAWADALATAHDRLGYDFFDWLSAVDELTGGFAVLAHLWSTTERQHLLMRTRLPADEPRLASATGVFRGANWHERETHEMFGIVFEGHPNLTPLLLPEGFEGHPLRKDFVLASRVVKAWPGRVEPGQSPDAAPRRSRRRNAPPGVPDPDEWGPTALRADPGDPGERR